MVNMKEIFAFERISNQECELAPLSERELSSALLEDGDLLFARQSLTFEGAGKCVLVLPADGPRTWESHLIRVRLDKIMACPAFYYYYFNSIQGRLSVQTIVQQVAAAGIRGSDLSRLSVPFPAIEVQWGISDVLGALDDKIAANTQLAETTAELAALTYSSFQAMRGDRHPLDELVTTQYGFTTSAHSEPGPKFLRVTDINKRPWITWFSTPNCSLGAADLAKYRVREGDILVARMADPGKAAFIDEGDPEAVFASYLVRLKAKDPEDALFIYYFLRSDEYRNYSEGAMQGSVQMNMNAKVIVATDMFLPNREGITLFNSRIRPLRRVIQSALTENVQLAATRDALLPQLMSGKLRVKDAEQTLAGVL
ncbi:restriction endonuclease subunit S [Cryobacterium sp. Hh7]|uniref:restriction endonuclease subunit S n=1 Tax=Cryobacterium sp. Hh7 TaxID=1259159 RepID=UPI00106D3D89|nr:restriction endonuclease subunit S [Cryobacterium sp. Hh7]TFD61203.1 restriction endonuclease subunit S [Cryobacterium sp. Hh7]